MKFLEENFGVKGTFSYSQEYLDFEQYTVFQKETFNSLLLALVSVGIILLLVTMSFTLTLLLIGCMLLTVFFMTALIHIWGLTFNAIIVVNLMVAMGFAIEYSLHIAYTYPKLEPPAVKQYKT
jgi:Niemann-Pick C1 protein